MERHVNQLRRHPQATNIEGVAVVRDAIVSDELSADGKSLMPLDDYGFSRRFAWVADRFGVSWQLDLS
ncbi:MAG: VOC family protein [Nitrobacter sp.]|nr:VOC family protein [Nitrobacter sp.]MCV0386905.1 VOC family protein [Nitrobacter sp.]